MLGVLPDTVNWRQLFFCMTKNKHLQQNNGVNTICTFCNYLTGVVVLCIVWFEKLECFSVSLGRLINGYAGNPVANLLCIKATYARLLKTKSFKEQNLENLNYQT